MLADLAMLGLALTWTLAFLGLTLLCRRLAR